MRPINNGGITGAHAGYSWLNSNSAYDVSNPAAEFNNINLPTDMSAFDINLTPSGFVAGGQIGYNYQFENNVVVGIEGKLSYLGLDDRMEDQLALNFNNLSTDTISSSIDLQGTIAAKLGYAFGNTLPYLTAGYTWAKSNYSDTQGPHSVSKTLHGWAVGGGLEQKLSQNISVKVEYLHAMFDKETYFEGQWYQGSSKPVQDTLLVGLNYHF